MVIPLALVIILAFLLSDVRGRPGKLREDEADKTIRWKATTTTNTHLNRQLQTNSFAYVSLFIDGLDWCITASNGTHRGDPVTIRRCNFENRPATQMWQFNDGKFRSEVDPEKCIAVNNLNSGGRRVRMMPCEEETLLNQFVYEEAGGSITVQADTSLCLTHQGNAVDVGDHLVAKNCNSSGSFFFDYLSDRSYSGFNNDFNGCMVVENEMTAAGSPVILGNCSLFNHDWREDSEGLFHSGLDDTMCMQVGTATSGPPMPGNKIRVYPCNSTNEKQLFDYDGVFIRFQNSDSLCIGSQGQEAEVGKDHIILRGCDKPFNNWSTD